MALQEALTKKEALILIRQAQTKDLVWEIQKSLMTDKIIEPLHTTKEAFNSDVHNFGLNRVKKALIGRLAI
jgi:hypothetical protein